METNIREPKANPRKTQKLCHMFRGFICKLRYSVIPIKHHKDNSQRDTQTNLRGSWKTIFNWQADTHSLIICQFWLFEEYRVHVHAVHHMSLTRSSFVSIHVWVSWHPDPLVKYKKKWNKEKKTCIRWSPIWLLRFVVFLCFSFVHFVIWSVFSIRCCFFLPFYSHTNSWHTSYAWMQTDLFSYG